MGGPATRAGAREGAASGRQANRLPGAGRPSSRAAAAGAQACKLRGRPERASEAAVGGGWTVKAMDWRLALDGWGLVRRRAGLAVGLYSSAARRNGRRTRVLLLLPSRLPAAEGYGVVGWVAVCASRRAAAAARGCGWAAAGGHAQWARAPPCIFTVLMAGCCHSLLTR